MSKKYFVWKNPSCGGKNIEWLELTGKEFYVLMSSQENRGRRFIRLENDICPDADIIFIESTEEQYHDWKREQNVHEYLARLCSMFEVLSMDISTEDISSLHEAVPDQDTDVEGKVLEKITLEQLEQALNRLPPNEYMLLAARYAERKTTVQLAEEYRVSQQYISKRLKAIVTKLKKIWL